MTTEIHTPDLCELPELLDTAFEIEAKSWKGEAGTALAHDVHRAVFYRQYAEAACVEGTQGVLPADRRSRRRHAVGRRAGGRVLSAQSGL